MTLDRLNRNMRDLRISVTDYCTFRCPYCLPIDQFPSDYQFLKAGLVLTFEEILTLVEAFHLLGVEKVKLTGGEPLLRSLLTELIAEIKIRFPKLFVGLITNGLHLSPLVSRLKKAGLDGITVSLDAIDQESFEKMTGSGHQVQKVLEGIEAAREAGFKPLKINAVILRGKNEDQILPLVQYFRRPGFDLRFIEFMDVGTLNKWDRSKMVSTAEILSILEPLGSLAPLPARHRGETANRYQWADVDSEVGFISSVSNPFCADCTRVRLGADGRLYTCLFSNKGWDLRTPLRQGATAQDLAEMIHGIWSKRDDRYSELRGEVSAEKPEMFAIGG